MLIKLINRLVPNWKKKSSTPLEKKISLEEATERMFSGDRHGAIALFRNYLKTNPYNVQALNNLGYCLVDIGDAAGAIAAFELAYSMDDTFIPGVANYANMLKDQRRSSEALSLLNQAKIVDPESPHVDAVYAGVFLNLGDPKTAKKFALKAWLASFDVLRNANCYLVYAAYGDFDEANMAAEHRFWAETIRPIELPKPDEVRSIRKTTADLIESNNDHRSAVSKIKKIRIGYWSPDFRNHSVRYFFRPLLEGHDTERFETFLYHDFPKDDQQTGLISNACDHFYDICEFSDAELIALIESHQLDIFVELTGHMSHNRVSLLQHRFAKVQITGIGYPPTTGMKTVDAKIIDRFIETSESNRYYVEMPLVMPKSFWCFDPMEEAQINPEPALVRNGYITFACVGNTAKITEKMQACWRKIILQVPNSRLLIRSHTFLDPASENSLRKSLEAIDFPLDRVEFKKPEDGEAFFDSYNEIDIILDTFPFNGGTTSCFSTYMGVPIVSLAGHSLISRMGLSIMSNLGAPELISSNEADYVECAVKTASDLGFLKKFRREVRGLYKQSSLGNGKLFAHEFEVECIRLLEKKNQGTLEYATSVYILPAEELVRRAFTVQRFGQIDAAKRILSHCLKHYPISGGAHNLLAQLLSSEGLHEEAVEYLNTRLSTFSKQDQIEALISVAHFGHILSKSNIVLDALNQIENYYIDDAFDLIQIKMFRAFYFPRNAQFKMASEKIPSQRIKMLISCNEIDKFNEIKSQISNCCTIPFDWSVDYIRCNEEQRIEAYQMALSDLNFDIVVIIQKNIEIHNSQFFFEIADALTYADIVGFAGANSWSQIEWRKQDFDVKAGSYMVTSAESNSGVELLFIGKNRNKLMLDAAVLDGGLFAVRKDAAKNVQFEDRLLSGENAMEEWWLHSAFKNANRLAVHNNLGILINRKIVQNSVDVAAQRTALVELLEIDPFMNISDGSLNATLTVPNPKLGVQCIQELLYTPGLNI